MNKNILLEINRLKEIMGLTVLSEGKIPGSLISDLASAFSKSEDEFFESLGKGEMVAIDRVFDDLASTTGNDVADLINDFKLGKLSDDVEDLFVAKMIKSGTESIKDAAVKAYSQGKKTIITLLNEFDSDIVRDVVKNGTDDVINQYIKETENVINSATLTDDMKKYLKKELNDTITSLKTEKLKNIKPKPTITINDVWNTAETYAKSKNKKLPPKEYFTNLEDEIVKKGMTKKELIDIIMKDATDKKAMIEYVKDARKVGSEIGGALKDTADGTIGFSRKALASLSVGSILILGAIGFGFNTFGMRDAIAHGTKSSTWKDIYKEEFYDLPEDVQKIISSNYEGKATNDPNSKDGVKSFTYSEDSPDTFTVNFMNNTSEVWNKTRTNDVKSWTKATGSSDDSQPKTTMTKQEATDAILVQGYTEPITFTPDSDGQTSYKFVDAGGLDGTATLNNGNIIVQ